ncbi:MAG: 23S rRNA (guanosine(2251)-2'-O)-methyltransferase RlmB [Acidimicrobiia bacterium]|nr:23S rRNA (guanosine(2251)-2'-O)-methyltransferase RlmB [Acidimicrobiia bacterium]
MAFAGIGHRVEGAHPVRAALESGRVLRLKVEKGRLAKVQDLVEAARARGIPVDIVDDVRSFAETTAPQGVVAECRPRPSHSIDELVALSERPALLVLDHLEDPHNVGAVARSAAAAGMTGLVVSSVRAAPLGATAFKASVGALERIPVAVVSSVAAAIDRLRALEVWIIGLDFDGEQSLFGLDLLTESVALVIGAEGGGLARLVRERCDVVASIPMGGATESLNASVAAALAAFEVGRVRGRRPE